ncbi:MAG TPA: acyltransferase [Bacteroidales bacterium]|nr:acyltransferase [Bacteroidales bacterium]
MKLIDTNSYRKDIDGLRAIAVIAVILFHFGLLPSGYLGVDVFFVISGYLITGIIYRELKDNRFSVVNFYIRRIRRILPLTLFLVFISLAIGIIVMLPDDLENLAESVVATNIFGNNLLQAITTQDYWDISNEFNPLMHTWSLGIEEQYYILYPVLLLLIGRRHGRWLLPSLALLAAASLILYFLPFHAYKKFYYLPFRFFELALGGMAALYLKDKIIAHRYAAIFVLALIAILFVKLTFLPGQYALPVAVILTLGIIVTANHTNKIASFILQNKISVTIGLISFSLYMWHQIILAYVRYFLIQKLQIYHLAFIFLVVVILSGLTYYAIERPFRNKNMIGKGVLFSTVGMLFLTTTLFSLSIYWKGGVIKDVPELGISKLDAGRGIHAKYNQRVYTYGKPFNNNRDKIKVLVVGESFARDWVNVLLESKYRNSIEISYVMNPLKSDDFKSRVENADVIFYAETIPEFYSEAGRVDIEHVGIDNTKLFIVGTKNFGINSGYFYNQAGEGYFSQRTKMNDGYLEFNEKLKHKWRNKYIDLIEKVIDEKGTVPVFSPDKMFISQDCRHFTKAGASYFSQLLDDELSLIFARVKTRKETLSAKSPGRITTSLAK